MALFYLCSLGSKLLGLWVVGVIAIMSATDQLIVAVATLIIAVAGLLPAALTLWSHVIQNRQLGANAAKLDRIDASTNGTLSAMRAEIASLRAELVASKGAHPS